LLKIDDLFHPFIKEPVKNNIHLEQDKNMCFLTGANMAGKSTFLKSIGLCCYMAHLGFPVPAAKMETNVFNGLITTINISDDVTKGYSHFYSEVKRVKNTALKIQEKKKVLVIFDELFRGTNVKDAFDASSMIISAFADISQCAFFISTHIVEIAQELKIKPNIVYKFFNSRLDNEIPVYNYKLNDGISEERHGLQIVKNEGIVEILKQVVQDNNSGFQ
jgi:DNA mismatch repair ATPase MutS